VVKAQLQLIGFASEVLQVLHLNDRLLAAITFWLHGYGIQQPPAFVDSISDLQRLQADQQRAGLIVMPFR